MKALFVNAEWKPKAGYRLTEAERIKRKAFTGNQVWRNPHFEFKEVPTPDLEDDEVLIKVKACGICGSDTHLYETDAEGYIIFSGVVKLPCIVGHEFSGIVEKKGGKVSRLNIGDAVASESILWCGLCTPCRRGDLNQCQQIELLGLSSYGALAEFIAIKEKYCWKLNGLRQVTRGDELFEIGALIEPVGCAYNGLFVGGGGFNPGDTLVVYGAGPIGLASIALGRIAGASKIIAFDMLDKRLELAKTMGADFVFNLVQLQNEKCRPSDKVLELTGGEGANIQIEAAGDAPRTIPEMESSMAPNSKIIYLGRAATFGSLNINVLVSGAGRIQGVRGHAGNDIFPNIIKLLETRRLRIGDMITARYQFSEALEAIKCSTYRNDGKILVKM
ncbi:MAG: scyllo-inosose 3-dehydrogenase [Pseudomonadota bacterium]